MRVFKWRRVGGTPIQTVFSSMFAVVGTVATLGLLYLLIRGVIRGTLQSWPGVLFALLFLAAWTAFAFRLGRIGVFISETSVRNRSMWRTRTIAWADVNRFETRPMTKGLGSAFAAMFRAHAVWILLTNGAALETSLVFRDKSDFLAAKRVTKFGDAVAGPAFSLGEQSGMTLSDKGAQQALRELSAAHKAARN